MNVYCNRRSYGLLLVKESEIASDYSPIPATAIEKVIEKVNFPGRPTATLYSLLATLSTTPINELPPLSKTQLAEDAERIHKYKFAKIQAYRTPSLLTSNHGLERGVIIKVNKREILNNFNILWDTPAIMALFQKECRLLLQNTGPKYKASTVSRVINLTSNILAACYTICNFPGTSTITIDTTLPSFNGIDTDKGLEDYRWGSNILNYIYDLDRNLFDALLKDPTFQKDITVIEKDIETFLGKLKIKYAKKTSAM